jgi:prophage antirepressor-like protein
MNEINTTFSFDTETVRVAGTPDSPVFCAKDVCETLGLSKYRDAIASLDSDERVSISVDTLGGTQEMTFVTESGLYSLIFKSRKENANRFRKWVTGEVLPAIRKTGTFSVAPIIKEYTRIELLKMNLAREEDLLAAQQLIDEVNAEAFMLPHWRAKAAPSTTPQRASSSRRGKRSG